MVYLTFAISIIIAAVAAWYSIAGLTAIFSAAAIPVIIMGSALEVGKLVTASWLYRNWRLAPILMKAYLLFALIVLMLITSMGIFGFLSKAHLDQTISQGGNNEIRIESLERKIARQNDIIDDAEKVMAQLDQAVETLQKYDRIRGPDGALSVRASQAEERESLNESINAAYNRIEQLQEELLPLQKQQLALEAEVGPLKYIAEMIYGKDNAADNFDSAVRFIIILIVVVFDPLAVILLIAANMSLNARRMGVNEEGKIVLDAKNVSIIE